MVARPSSGPRLRIFISYGHDEHANFALNLKEDLLARGHEVWFDLDKLKPGMEWERYIEDGLSWASRDGNGRMILIMTPHSVRRPDGFCLNELAMALMKKIRIIPILLVWCEPPLSICRIQRLDMQDCLPLEERKEKYEVKFQGLIDALEQGLHDYEGHQTSLFNVLKPLSFDAEIKYNLDKFTGRAWVFGEIDRWLQDTNASRVFWIMGGPGVGKTAISSYLAAHRPEIAALHFCRYDNVQKRDPRRAIMSIAYQLSTQLQDYEERLRHVNMDDIQGLDARTLFDHLILQPFNANYPDPGRKVVILIDALDEATADGKNELASLISTMFNLAPKWLRLIVTSRPSPEIMAPLQTYKPFTIDISDPRNFEDIKAYLERELGHVKSAVKPQDIEAIVEKSGGLFLYAEWIVAEISKGHLSLDRPEEFPHNLGGIYLKLFERQIPDVQEWENIIAPALDVIAAAQEPLSIDLLATIFKWNVRDKHKFQRELGTLFTYDHGIQPFHKSVMDWLLDETKQDPYFIDAGEGNTLLAEHLWQEYKNSIRSHYLISYLPQHLFMAQRWQELETLLLDMEFISVTVEADKWRLFPQLININEQSPIKFKAIYGNDFPLEGKNEKGLLAIAELFTLCSHFDECERILGYLIPYYRKTNDLVSLSQALGIKYFCTFMRTRWAEASTLVLEWEEVSRKTNNKKLLAEALTKKSRFYSMVRDWDQAVRTAMEAEQISREIGYEFGIANGASVLGMAKMYTLDLDGSILLFTEEERLDRGLGRLDILTMCLLNQGFVYKRKGDYQTALAKLEEAANLSRPSLPSLGMVLAFQGWVYEAMDRLDDAMFTYEESEKLCKEWNKLYLCFPVTGLGRVYYKRNRIEEAAVLFKKALEITKATGEEPMSTQLTLGALAVDLAANGDKKGAREVLERRAMICKKLRFEYDYQNTMEQMRALEAGEELKLPT